MGGSDLVLSRSIVLVRRVLMEFMEDNESTIAIIKTGKSKALRHVHRTHGVQKAWLHEVFRDIEQLTLNHQISAGQCADIFTKVFRDAKSW